MLKKMFHRPELLDIILLFFENPRAASTSVVKSLSETYIGGSSFQIKPQHMINDVSYPNHHFSLTPQERKGKVITATTIRNPWERMVSGWMHESQGSVGFEQWLLGDPWFIGAPIDFKRTSQSAWALNSQVVLCVEHLKEQYVSLLQGLSVSLEEINKHDLYGGAPVMTGSKLNASSAGHSSLAKAINWREYYNNTTINIVADRFRWDIETYDYSFEEDAVVQPKQKAMYEVMLEEEYNES